MDSFPCPYCLGTVPGGSEVCPYCEREVDQIECLSILKAHRRATLDLSGLPYVAVHYRPARRGLLHAEPLF